MFAEVKGDKLCKRSLVIGPSIVPNYVLSYLVLKTQLLQDDRSLEAIRCALCIERNIGLDTHYMILFCVNKSGEA